MNCIVIIAEHKQMTMQHFVLYVDNNCLLKKRLKFLHLLDHLHNIEEELAKIIYVLVNSRKKVVGLVD